MIARRALAVELFILCGSSDPPLVVKAGRIEDELRAQLPIGSSADDVEDAFHRRGWTATYDPILNNYGFLIKQAKDGILIRAWLNRDRRLRNIEVKAVYSPDLG